MSITVHQHTPSSRATTATGSASSPTWRVASAPARSVRTARGATCSVLSVQVLAAQSRSTQRQRRFSQTSRVGRPKHGRSLMSTLTRSLASARTPQVAHQTKSAVVSTVHDRFGRGLFDGQHPEPVESQQRFCQARSVVHRQGSSSLGRQATSTMSGPLAAFADTSLRHIPQFNTKSPSTSPCPRRGARRIFKANSLAKRYEWLLHLDPIPLPDNSRLSGTMLVGLL